MSSCKSAARWLALALTVLLIGQEHREAEAFVRIPCSTDMIVLESDAIVMATVEKLDVARDDSGAVEVSLSRVRHLGGRWRLEPENSIFRVRRHQYVNDSVRPTDDGMALRLGSRYLLFLRGGAWGSAPLLRSAQSIFEIRDDRILCNGGQIYGIGDYGLICSTPERQAAPPLTESILAEQLGEALRIARLRRPALASQSDREARTLSLTRSSFRRAR